LGHGVEPQAEAVTLPNLEQARLKLKLYLGLIGFRPLGLFYRLHQNGFIIHPEQCPDLAAGVWAQIIREARHHIAVQTAMAFWPGKT
jgi:hypothetical protein